MRVWRRLLASPHRPVLGAPGRQPCCVYTYAGSLSVFGKSGRWATCPPAGPPPALPLCLGPPPPVLRPAPRRKRGLKNLTVITADLVDFQAPGTYDRVVSIECFEHMKVGYQIGMVGRAVELPRSFCVLRE